MLISKIAKAEAKRAGQASTMTALCECKYVQTIFCQHVSSNGTTGGSLLLLYK